jgi:hypothetical protein
MPVQNLGLSIGVVEHEPATSAEACARLIFQGAAFGKHAGAGLCPPFVWRILPLLSAMNPGGSLKENPRHPFLGQSISFPVHLPHMLPSWQAVSWSLGSDVEHPQVFPVRLQKVGG